MIVQHILNTKRFIIRKGEGKRILIEASGGINLENILDVAATGVDRISIGEITHSPRILDISLEVRTPDMDIVSC